MDRSGPPDDRINRGAKGTPDRGGTRLGSSGAKATKTVDGWPSSQVHAVPVSVGPYKIKELLGVGGMGAVFLAEQKDPIRRMVAVKLIGSTVASEHTIRRFEAERQALAMMEHPSIARVFDAGATETGEPYFAMEYVDGVPITTYCDDRKLSVRDRLKLVCAVCEGVQHAHQKGVIHRDLKPTNVLVEDRDDASPKIIDFGIAKAVGEPLTDAALVTGDRLLGTPAYMSPERLNGEADIDTRADVYSIGVMLYELLTGVLPFDLDGGNRFEQLQHAATSDPQLPSARVSTYDGELLTNVAAARNSDPAELPRSLSGDLDWITLKAIAPDRGVRYGSAVEFAADIRRYLADEPVLASPPSLFYRSRKLVRRNRLVVALSALLATALVGGMVTTTLQARRANREAEGMRRVSDFMTGLFQVSNPAEARGESVTAREILDRGVRQIDTELVDQPLLRARLLGAMGTVHVSLGLYDSGAEILEEALAINEKHLGKSHAEVAEILEPLARVRLAMGSPAESEIIAVRVLEIRKATVGRDHVLTARAASRLALAIDADGRREEAEVLYRRALEVQRRQGDHEELATTLTYMANLRLRQERPEEAEELYREAVQVMIAESGRTHPTVGHLLGNIGTAQRNQGRRDEAVASYLDGIAILEDVLPSDHPELARSLFPLAELYTELGRLKDAEPIFERVAAIRKEWMPLDHPFRIETTGALVENKARLGKHEEAEALMTAELDRVRVGLGPGHVNTAKAEAGLGYLRFMLGRLDEAEDLLRSAEVVLDDSPGAERVHWQVLRALSMICFMTDRTEMGNDFAHRAGVLADRMSVHGPDESGATKVNGSAQGR